jgi:hypothetical protein
MHKPANHHAGNWRITSARREFEVAQRADFNKVLQQGKKTLSKVLHLQLVKIEVLHKCITWKGNRGMITTERNHIEAQDITPELHQQLISTNLVVWHPKTDHYLFSRAGEFVMRKRSCSEHTLLIQATPRERLAAHWYGFNQDDPRKGVQEFAA